MGVTKVRRWVGECDFSESKSTGWEACSWNARKDPKLHDTADGAVREARDHAVAAGHVGSREVAVEREWKPRELKTERIVT